MSIITDWTPEKAAALTKANLSFEHGLHERPMFSDAGLEELLDRYPREKLGVFTMGEDPVAWTTWRRGRLRNRRAMVQRRVRVQGPSAPRTKP